MNNEIDKLYKKLDEQRIWYLDQIADIKNELDRVNKAWIKEHTKVFEAINYINREINYNSLNNYNKYLENILEILRGDKEC